MSVLGFEFYLGPEVPPPLPIDHTLHPTEVMERRQRWFDALDEAVRENDAWGVLITRPNCDVVLYDVSAVRLLAATKQGFTAHLLLAKDVSKVPKFSVAVTEQSRQPDVVFVPVPMEPGQRVRY